jgi:hypothetical protein
MKRVLAIIPVLFLAGCFASAPVKRNFPDIPDDLKKSCPELKTIDNGTDQLSRVITTVTENYAQYHECKLKTDTWLEWYKQQKKIFDASQ